jgi:hypothetical protein
MTSEYKNYKTAFSPHRIQTAEKPSGRKDRLKKVHEKGLSQQRNPNSLKNANNTFFITQVTKEKKGKINLNKSVVGESKTTSHRRLNRTEIESGDEEYVSFVV